MARMGRADAEVASAANMPNVRTLEDLDSETKEDFMTTEEIAVIPVDRYYQLFIEMMAEAEKKKPLPPGAPSFQTMLEKMMADGLPIVNIIIQSLEQRPDLKAVHKEKLREALLWKQQQLQTRKLIFGNPN